MAIAISFQRMVERDTDNIKEFINDVYGGEFVMFS